MVNSVFVGTGAACDGNSVKVTVAFTDATDASTAPTEATLDTNNSKKMSLDLSTWVRANQGNKGKTFTVTYYAKVNKDAVVTNNNQASLEYGNKPGDTTTTTPSEAKTNTYPLDMDNFFSLPSTTGFYCAGFLSSFPSSLRNVPVA